MSLGELKSGPGGRAGKVKTRRQAVAIALKEAGASKYESEGENKRNLAKFGYSQSDVAGLCDHQGCNSKFYSRIGAVALGKIIPFERGRKVARVKPNSRHRDYSRLSCGGGRRSSG
jgi:hypothetical protein